MRLYETETKTEKIKEISRKRECAAGKTPELRTIPDVQNCSVDELGNVLYSKPWGTGPYKYIVI